jgi:hypothetical protein
VPDLRCSRRIDGRLTTPDETERAMSLPDNTLEPHPEDAKRDAEKLAGEPGSAEADGEGRGETGEGFGPLPGDEDDEHAG